VASMIRVCCFRSSPHVDDFAGFVAERPETTADATNVFEQSAISAKEAFTKVRRYSNIVQASMRNAIELATTGSADRRGIQNLWLASPRAASSDAVARPDTGGQGECDRSHNLLAGEAMQEPRAGVANFRANTGEVGATGVPVFAVELVSGCLGDSVEA